MRLNRYLFIALASLWQIAAYQIRPVIGDKEVYVSLAEAISANDYWYLLYKEPIFSLISKLSFEAEQIFSVSVDNGVGFVNIISSVLVAIGLARLTRGRSRDFLLLLPLFFLYDFIYLSAETIRAHLGMGFLLLHLAARRSGRGSFAYGIAAALTHFSLVVPLMVLQYLDANRHAKLVSLVFGVGLAVVAVMAVGLDNLTLLLNFVAGASVETARRYPEVRAYIIPLLVLVMLLFHRSGANVDIKIVAGVFTVLTPTLYLVGATEIALRAFSAAMIFITLLLALRRGRINAAAQFTVLMALVLLYTSVSPLAMLYAI